MKRAKIFQVLAVPVIACGIVMAGLSMGKLFSSSQKFQQFSWGRRELDIHRDQYSYSLAAQGLQFEGWKFSPGRRFWQSKRNLTYAFSSIPETRILSERDVRFAIGIAFASWSSVISLRFVEINNHMAADITIEFHSGDHGDGSPFDGRLGILSHAFSPEDGRFHLDSDEIWTVDMALTDDESAIDLETVALHEIGHLIGLDHSTIEAAVMYPTLEARHIKRRLTADDIQAAHALYAPPPLTTSRFNYKKKMVLPNVELHYTTAASSASSCLYIWPSLILFLVLVMVTVL